MVLFVHSLSQIKPQPEEPRLILVLLHVHTNMKCHFQAFLDELVRLALPNISQMTL